MYTFSRDFYPTQADITFYTSRVTIKKQTN